MSGTWKRRPASLTVQGLARRGRPTLTAQDPQVVLPLESPGGAVVTLTAASGDVPITGTAAALTSTHRNAFRIDGQQDALQLQTRSGRFPVTMSGWFYAVSSRGGAYMGLLSIESSGAGTYNEVGIEGGTFRVYDHVSGLLASAGTASTGVWYKVALVITSGAFELYVGQQGTPDVTLIASGAMTNASANDYQGIGATQFASSEWFDGRISGLRVWNSARTEAQIEADFASETPLGSPLGAWFPGNLSAAAPLTAQVGADLIDGAGSGTPDYTIEDGPQLDSSATTLTADAGAVAIAGTAATLRRGLLLTASSGAAALTGSAANLELGHVVVATPGAIGLAGTAAALSKASRLSSAFGAVPLSGTVANLNRGLRLTAAAGSVPIDGTAATLRKGRALAADLGAVAIAGTAATFRRALRTVADPGAVALTGSTAALVRGLRLTSSTGSVPLTGSALTLVKSRVLVASSSSVPLTGSPAALARALRLTAAIGSSSITGSPAGLRAAWRAAASSGSVAITGSAAALSRGRTLAAALGSVSFAGSAAALRADRRLASSSGAVALTGAAAELVYTPNAPPVLEALGGSWSVTGSSVAFRLALRLGAAAGTVPITGSSVNAGPLVMHLVPFGELASCTAVEGLAELVPLGGINAYAESATPNTGAEPQ